MRKFICTICGYIYDETIGDKENGFAAGTQWDDLPSNWVCPVCGAGKSDFEEQKSMSSQIPATHPKPENEPLQKDLSNGALSALFSNLAKGCEKQYRPVEAEKFFELAQYYQGKGSQSTAKNFSDIEKINSENILSDFPKTKSVAVANSDRGAQRALVWGEKVTRIVSSLLTRYEKEKEELLEGKTLYVCEICGFIYLGDEAPEICPVCKVPGMKIKKIERRAV